MKPDSVRPPPTDEDLERRSSNKAASTSQENVIEANMSSLMSGTQCGEGVSWTKNQYVM